MTETWTPKPVRKPLKAVRKRCGRCHGAHTDWWKSTPPPSCRAAS